MQSLSNWPEYVQDMLVLAFMATVLVTLICRSRHNWWVRYKWLGLMIGLVTVAAALIVQANLTPHGSLVPLGQSLLIAGLGSSLITLFFLLLPRREDEWRDSEDFDEEDMEDATVLHQPPPVSAPRADAVEEPPLSAPIEQTDVVADQPHAFAEPADIDLVGLTSADTLSFDHDDLDPRILDESLDLSETEAIYRTLRDQPVVVDLPDNSTWSDLDDTADHSTDFGDSLLPESAARNMPPIDVADTTGAVHQAAIEAEFLEGEYTNTASRRMDGKRIEDDARAAAEQVIAAQKQLLEHAHRKNRKLQAVIKDQKQRIEKHRQQTEKARNMARNAARAARLAAQRAAESSRVTVAAAPKTNREPTRQRPAKPMRRTPELTKSD